MIIPFAGRVMDKIRNNNIIPLCIICIALLIIPYLYVITTHYYYLIVIFQIAITIPAAFYFAAVPVLLVELMNSSIRYRTFSFGYNLSAAIFGGTTPFIALSLVEKTNLSYMPGLYLIICAIITSFIYYLHRPYFSILL